MLSISAYDLLNVIVEGEVTAHTLWAGLRHRLGTDRAADEQLLSALCELCTRECIAWSEEHEYGRSARQDPSVYTVGALVDSWLAGFDRAGPRGDQPCSFTLSIRATLAGERESQHTRYEVYGPLLRAWFDWD